MTGIDYRINPEIGNDTLNALFAASWPSHMPSDFSAPHRHSLAYVCAFAEDTLIGYVNLAWDGGSHAFLLDTTVLPEWRRRGVGHQLVLQAIGVARTQGIEWIHVDYEPRLTGFYRACGFRPTEAGLIWLKADVSSDPGITFQIAPLCAEGDLEHPSQETSGPPMPSIPTQQLMMIARLRDACRSDPRVVAAALYGSFVTGEADAFSDIEAALYFEPDALATLDRQAWVEQIAPVALFFADDFGHYTAIFESLIRGEFHFNPAESMAEIESWRGAAWFPSVNAAVLVDRTGELTQRMGALDHLPPERDSSETAYSLVANFLNGVLFGSQVLARGEAARALEILTCGVLRHLERMARLVEASTDHWPTPSRGWERDLSPAVQARLRDCTARLDPIELAQAYRNALAWGETLAETLAQGHSLAWPDAAFSRITQHLDNLQERPEW
jgi:lincosamide nucleotidyltransferase